MPRSPRTRRYEQGKTLHENLRESESRSDQPAHLLTQALEDTRLGGVESADLHPTTFRDLGGRPVLQDQQAKGFPRPRLEVGLDGRQRPAKDLLIVLRVPLAARLAAG